MLDVQELLHALSLCRTVFHSEADFQHELALAIKQHHPKARIRLEYPPPAFSERAYVDIWVRLGDQSAAIELKYKTRLGHLTVEGEQFLLRNQSAQDLGRYDFLKDVERLQRVVEAHRNTCGYAIFLTNDPSYWTVSQNTQAADADFRLHEGRNEFGTLRWGPTAQLATMESMEAGLTIRPLAPLCWQDYSVVGDGVGAKFRSLTVEVAPVSPPA